MATVLTRAREGNTGVTFGGFARAYAAGRVGVAECAAEDERVSLAAIRGSANRLPGPRGRDVGRLYQCLPCLRAREGNTGVTVGARAAPAGVGANVAGDGDAAGRRS